MTNARARITSVLAALGLAVTIGLVPGSPAQAEPEISDVQEQVDALYHEAEEAQERHHDARIVLAELQDELASVRADESRADASLEDVRTQARDAILRQYAGSSLTAVGEVLSADDPGQFLEQVSTMSSYQRIQQGLFDTYSTGLKALNIRRAATSKRLAEVADVEAQLTAEAATIDDNLDDAEQLLSRLEDEEQERRLALSRSAARSASVVSESVAAEVPVSAPAASGRASAAVAYAMGKVGNSYVYGAAGPSAFDCSGLTMMAWAAAGVALPHSSTMQFNTGTRVAAGDLIPGDLVFYYSPISHVGMYIGNGMIVDAANPGTGVRTASLYSMPYVGAVRPG